MDLSRSLITSGSTVVNSFTYISKSSMRLAKSSYSVFFFAIYIWI